MRLHQTPSAQTADIKIKQPCLRSVYFSFIFFGATKIIFRHFGIYTDKQQHLLTLLCELTSIDLSKVATNW